MNRSLAFSLFRIFTFTFIFYLSASTGFSATSSSKRRHHKATSAAKRVTTRPTVQLASFQKTRTTTSVRKAPAIAGPVIAGGPCTSPTYADSTDGDRLDGEDLEVRKAAVEALNGYNGSVVVVDPQTGRILSMVNQK